MRRKGFTLIELLIVVTLLGLILIGVTQLLGASLAGAGKATALAQLKESGQFAMSTIERTAKNASLVTTCDGSSTMAFSVSQNGVATSYIFSLSAGRLVRSVNGAAASPITDSAVTVSSFSCAQTAASPGKPAILLVTLTLAKPGALPEQNVVSQDFQTTLSLRTY